MKFESSQPEASFSLILANAQTIAISAFAQYEQQIQQLTDSLTEKDKTIANLKAKIHKLEPQPEIEDKIDEEEPEGNEALVDELSITEEELQKQINNAKPTD